MAGLDSGGADQFSEALAKDRRDGCKELLVKSCLLAEARNDALVSQ